jgi:uncharacterized RDD family membrane protein YckC
MSNSTPSVETPTLKRRFTCLVYEAFLVTAVVMFGMFVFLYIVGLFDSNQDSPLIIHGRQLVLFLGAGAYFVHSWTGSGHTLAMKTWRIKLVKVGFKTVPLKAAILRYIFAWGWVFPALLIGFLFKLSVKQEAAAFAIGIVAWGLTAFLDKDRQFLHDKLAGTRLISLPKRDKSRATPAAQAAK